MNKGKTRSSLMGVVGGYLIYLAWQLMEGRNDPETTMTPLAMWFFIVLFLILGAGLIWYAITLWKRADEEEAEERKNDDRALK